MENRNEAQKEQFEDVESIVFSADITNEEALTLQALKEKQGKHLVCPEAKPYQDFLKAYGSISGHHVFKGDIDTLTASDMIISFGVWFQDDSAGSAIRVREIVEEKKAKFVYMHPIEDATLQPTITQFIKYEVGSEEGVAALLAYALLEDKELPPQIEDILEEFDIGYLSAESNVGEEELESMYESIDNETTISLIIGSDLYTHPKAAQIAKLIALLESYAGVNVVCLPPAKNALGVALICQLDDVAQGRNVEYDSSKEGTYVDENGLKKDRMYKLPPQEITQEFVVDEIDDLPVYDGALIYTYKVKNSTLKEGLLYGSNQFAMATKLQDNDVISFEIEGVKFRRVFKIDTHLKGVIALNPVFDIKLSAYLISSYRFSRLAFEKIQ